MNQRVAAFRQYEETPEATVIHQDLSVVQTMLVLHRTNETGIVLFFFSFVDKFMMEV